MSFQDRVYLSNGFLAARFTGTRACVPYSDFLEHKNEDPSLPNWEDLPIRRLHLETTEELVKLVMEGDTWERVKAAHILRHREDFSTSRCDELSKEFAKKVELDSQLQTEEYGIPNVKFWLNRDKK